MRATIWSRNLCLSSCYLQNKKIIIWKRIILPAVCMGVKILSLRWI